jgi:hypothetical protein
MGLQEYCEAKGPARKTHLGVKAVLGIGNRPRMQASDTLGC